MTKAGVSFLRIPDPFGQHLVSIPMYNMGKPKERAGSVKWLIDRRLPPVSGNARKGQETGRNEALVIKIYGLGRRAAVEDAEL